MNLEIPFYKFIKNLEGKGNTNILKKREKSKSLYVNCFNLIIL